MSAAPIPELAAPARPAGKTPEEIATIVRLCALGSGDLMVWRDGQGLYLQVEFSAADAKDGVRRTFRGRKWRLSAHMTRSEIVQTALMAAIAAAEHEVREGFRYRGEAIFGPHFDVERLHALCLSGDAEDVRQESQS